MSEQPAGPWATTLPGTGMAGLAGTPVAPPPAKPKVRRGLIATIAAVCVVALLGGGAYWVFAAFLNPSHQLDSARYLPDSTFAYASIDLVALGTNSHHYTTTDINPGQQGQGTPDIIQSSLGLNWKTDVLPWLGRSVTIAAFPGAHPDQGSGNMQGALLLQSHDDTAAAAAVNKALAHLQQQGQQFTTSSYGGYTLHTDTVGSSAGIIATGSGMVLVTTTSDAAHAVIDRANGTGATLASASDFQHATSDLPSDRFGTMYVNLRALATAEGPAAGTISATVLNVYPSAAASLEWTQAGMRWQTTLKAAQGGVPASVVSGDTTSLAGLVPSSATVYAGVGNLGALVQSGSALISPSGGATPDPLQSAFGIAASDPLLQQGAAFATWGKASSAGAFFIHEASADQATQLLSRVAQKSGATLKATSVGGLDATEIIATSGTVSPFGYGGYSDTTPTATPGNPTTIGVEAYLNNVMVVAPSTSALQTVIDTSKAPSNSLAQSSNFSKLVSSAPGNAAATTYLDLSTLESVLGASASTTGLQATDTLFTLVWNNAELQLTSDVALNQ